MISALIYKHDAPAFWTLTRVTSPLSARMWRALRGTQTQPLPTRPVCVAWVSTVASPSHMWRVPMILICFLCNFFFLLWCWGRTQTLVKPGQDCQWTAPLVLTMSVFTWPPVVKLRHVSEVCGLLRAKSGKSHNKQKTQVWEWRALQRECNPSRDRGFVHYSKRQEPKTLRA